MLATDGSAKEDVAGYSVVVDDPRTHFAMMPRIKAPSVQKSVHFSLLLKPSFRQLLGEPLGVLLSLLTAPQRCMHGFIVPPCL